MIRLSKPSFSAKINKNIDKVISSGNLIDGFYTNKFETKINNYFKTNYSIAVSSGTAALHLSLLSIGIKKFDEVIIPSFSYIATANVVENVGATPIFVDIKIDNLCMNIDLLQKKITNKTKAIIIVHEFGNVCDMNKLMKLSKKFKIKVIEDAACSLGSKYENKLTGLFGDIACFSFHPRKVLTTSEGGIVLTKSIKDYKFIRSYKNHGLERSKNKIDFVFPGLNYRLSEINSVLGLNQFSLLNKNIKHRRKIAKIYNNHFSNNKNLYLTSIKDNIFCNYQSYHIILKENSIRNKLKKYLFLNKIESNVGAQAIPFQKFYKNKYKFKKKDFPNAYNAFKKGLVIPIGEHISEKNAHFIANKINNFF